ncbi:MAG: hypothetical protein B7Y53_04515 [Halothiobacillus sp. 28-55-5]|nr:MAG: hypothetical protein B7Y53_04515 [Halothiobacillus sp. 28-55-5]
MKAEPPRALAAPINSPRKIYETVGCALRTDGLSPSPLFFAKIIPKRSCKMAQTKVQIYILCGLAPHQNPQTTKNPHEAG